MADERIIRMPESRVVEIATRVVERHVAISEEKTKLLIAETVKQTLIQMGVGISDPIQMQRDFSLLRNFRTALYWVIAAVGGGAVTVAVGLILVALR